MSGAMFNSIGACDAMETHDTVYYKVDVPGLSKSDIKVRLHDGSLTISGDRPVEPLMHDARTLRHERHFGPFTRYV